MNFTIDIGNTTTKIALFENNGIILAKTCEAFTAGLFKDLDRKYEISNIIVSSVADNQTIINELQSAQCNIIEFDCNTPLPIKNEYKSPVSLGNDRLAAVVGANSIFPGSNVLVIDAGTAITYDIITDNAVYTGGNISPGMSMRFRALHKFTDRLPLVGQDVNYTGFGDTTESAIISGVQKGIIYELEGYYEDAGRKYSNLKVILTGGDAKFFDKILKKRIFVEPNLVCIGLNTILEYNVENR